MGPVGLRQISQPNLRAPNLGPFIGGPEVDSAPTVAKVDPSVEGRHLERRQGVQPRPQQSDGRASVRVSEFSRGPTPCACPLALRGQAPSGWGPITHLRVPRHPTGLLCAVRWGPLSGPLKEERNTVISPGAWLITYPRTAQVSKPCKHGAVWYCRRGGSGMPAWEGDWDPRLLKGFCFRQATSGYPWNGSSETPLLTQLGTRAATQSGGTARGLSPPVPSSVRWG